MNQKTFSLVAGVIFLVIALLHILRTILGWEATIAGVSIPFWVSWVGIVVAGYLGYQGIRQSKNS